MCTCRHEKAHPSKYALAEEELPVLLALCREEGRGEEQDARNGQRALGVAHVEEPTDYQAGEEDERIL